MTETPPTTTTTPTTDLRAVAPTEKVSLGERIVVLGIFGALALLAFYKGDTQAATGFATTIGVYYLAREGV